MNGILFPFGDPQGAPQLEPMRNAMERNAAVYWRAQAGLIEAMQDYANGWFARRHEGAQAALESARRMCLAHDPTEAAREMQAFWRGAMDRLAADALALQRQAAEAAAEAGIAAKAEAAQAANGRERPGAQAEAARPQA
jgi:hypothetical protein